MGILVLILMIFGLVSFAIAGFNLVTTAKVNFTPLGLFFWILAVIITQNVGIH